MAYGALGRRDIIGTFFNRLEAILNSSWGTLLSWESPSNQAQEIYRWLGQTPMVREWFGGRLQEQLNDYEFIIKNRKFESTLVVSLDDLRRDKTAQILSRINELAVRAGQHYEKLITDAVIANAACFDGQTFFSATHSSGLSGTQLNLLTATQIPAADVTTAAAPTPAEMAQIITQLVAYMYGWKDDQGEPINGTAKQFMVMVPINMYGAAIQATAENFLVTGATNPVQAFQRFGVSVVPIANPRLTTTTQMYIFRVDGELKPFIRQVEVPFQTQELGAGSDYEFTNDVNLFGVKALYNVGYGRWDYAARLTLI